jgi:hypothetical protein
MGQCINKDGTPKVKYKNYKSAKQFADEYNEAERKKNYLYTPIRAYKCFTCWRYHVGHSNRIRKGRKSLNLKFVGFINLTKKSERKDIIIHLNRPRYNKIVSESNKNHFWSKNTEFILSKIPKNIREGSKVYLYNSGQIKGYLNLIKIEDNRLICQSVFRKKKMKCDNFIGFKYYKE